MPHDSLHRELAAEAAGEQQSPAVLAAQVASLRQELAIAEERLKAAQEREAGVTRGDVIAHKGSLYLIHEVHLAGGTPYGFSVSPQKQNGQWSKARQGLYTTDYEVRRGPLP